MVSAREYNNLIESIIKNNRRFSGNEDLFEHLFKETIKRARPILATVEDINNAEVYLNKIVNIVILDAIKNKKSLKIHQNNVTPVIDQDFTSAKTYELDDQEEIIINIPDPASEIKCKITTEEEIRQIKDLILSFNTKERSKKYYAIFIMHYIDGLDQSEIAARLGINEEEVSKRLVELTQKIALHLTP